MSFQLTINWKSIAAIGGSVVGVILAKKVTPEQAADVLSHLFGTSLAVLTGNSVD